MLVMTYFQLSTKGDAEASDQEMEKKRPWAESHVYFVTVAAFPLELSRKGNDSIIKMLPC